MLRGFLFLDVGAAWFQGGIFFDERLQAFRRSFKFYDSQNGMLGDGRGSYGIGFAWFLGPFELTWTWAKRLQNSVFLDANFDGIPDSPDRVPDPDFKSGFRQSFYIGRSF